MDFSATSLEKMHIQKAKNRQNQVIKVRNLPKNYEPTSILPLFQKVSKIRCYQRLGNDLWIKFENIRDRKACLILDGYALNTKRIEVILNFSEEQIPVTAWAAMHGINSQEKYKLSFRNINQNQPEERKSVAKSRVQGVIAKIDPQVQQTMRQIFSTRYLYIMIVLYLLSIIVSKIMGGE